MTTFFSRMHSMITRSSGLKGSVAAGLLALAPTAAFAHHDRGLRIDIDLRPPVAVYAPAPIEERVWLGPVYETVSDRQWVEPVYQSVADRVWVPAHEELRDVVRHGRVVHRDRIFVPAHFEESARQVLVAEGHWQPVERQVLVTPGHWETRIPVVGPAPYYPH